MEYILQITDLTKHYPDFSVDHLTLHVPKGCIVGLIGENGAGKTTTMNMILNALQKEDGEILAFGQDHLSCEREIKQRIGVVQDACNLPFMFHASDIEAIMKRIYSQWDSAYYWKLLNQFGLPVKQTIGTFSKGMKVKMNFAIALAHHAELLLLDEATSGLDPVMRDDILDLLLNFVQNGKNGALFSTHIMSDLSKVADYIAFMHKGKLLFFKPKNELVDNYGLLCCRETKFSQIDQRDILAWKKQNDEYRILVENRAAAAEKYVDCAVIPASLDDIMLLYIRGEKE